jgi:hypothetical protein
LFYDGSWSGEDHLEPCEFLSLMDITIAIAIAIGI